MALFKHTKPKEQQKKAAAKTSKLKENEPQTVVDPDEEIAAVIALGLHFHLEDIHDYERAIITMQKVMRPYSPWSSKIYGIRQMPMHFPRTILKNK